MNTIVETFLQFSPRVQYRAPDWIFLDIASTRHLFQGEEGLMRLAVNLAHDLGFSALSAVADTPSGAQAFAMSHHSYICPPGEERERLRALSLPFLLHLEGLKAWERPAQLEAVISFFMMLGLKSIGDLARFTSVSFKERWGETGATIWNRMHALEKQVISPLIPTEELADFVHLDFPISLVSLLLHQMQKSLDFLFARLQGRCLYAQKMTIELHCEYSETRHKIEISPHQPSRQQELYVTLLEQRLEKILGQSGLDNPVRAFEISVLPCPEQSQQADFFEPRSSDRERLQNLISLLLQAGHPTGFNRIQPSVLPEQAWSLSPDITANLKEGEMANSSANSSRSPLLRAPRPTRLLRQPLPLSRANLREMKILSRNPIERLETGWWFNRSEMSSFVQRDYYFAVSSEGQCLWIYQNLKTEEYFLHGYFD